MKSVPAAVVAFDELDEATPGGQGDGARTARPLGL